MKQDRISGIVFMLIGAAVLVASLNYPVGTLQKPGGGFFRQPGEKRKAVMRLAHGQPVTGGEIADASRRERTKDLRHQPLCIRHVFIHVGADGNVEAAVLVIQSHAILNAEFQIRAAEGGSRKADGIGIDVDPYDLFEMSSKGVRYDAG